MAIQPISSPTEQQDSMFEGPTLFRGPESHEVTYDEADESAYEPTDDFSDESLEAVSDEPVHQVAGEAVETIVDTQTPASAPIAISGSEPASTEVTNLSESHSEIVAVPVLDPKPEQPMWHSTPAEKLVEAESDTLSALTVDDFAALEERVFRAVQLVRTERQARADAEERASALEAQLAAQAQSQQPIIERLQQEVDSLRAEREQVRQRVERLLSQLDALEL